ncbi:MAG TPA: hypothetical protein VMX36_01705 [Sedimentisphaerales bacterium]|nr:hypothetical protein [Sedimentisphaerales bacterium]
MNELCLILLAIPIYAAGCTTTFTVHVNGFSELSKPISDKASIYVTVDPNSRNPIFDKEIKAKIEMLLKWHGYVPAPNVELSDYRLAFQVGLDSHRVTNYTPLYRPFIGFHDRYWGDYNFGYTSYVPYFDTLYDQWLVMKVFANDRTAASEAGKVVWIGEVMTDTSVGDLRRVVSYLLVAGFEYFGVDTKRQMTLTIGPDDPRIIRISTLR